MQANVSRVTDTDELRNARVRVQFLGCAAPLAREPESCFSSCYRDDRVCLSPPSNEDGKVNMLDEKMSMESERKVALRTGEKYMLE